MEKKELEAKITQAFSHATPNVLDSVLSECKVQKGNVIAMTETKKKHPIAKWAAACAAFVVLAAGVIGFRTYNANYSVASIVSLEVNPSIEIKINQKERVLEVNPLNEDGKIVIADMDFKGSDLNVTVNALIGSMLRNGYLNEIANSILVSVSHDDPAKSAELQARLTDEINALLQTDTFNGAVLSQTISSDADLQKQADAYGITLGKTQLIQQIISQNTMYTFEELVPLSINELNLLSESGRINLDNVSSAGTASDKAYIGESQAKELVLTHAGVASNDIYDYEFEMDYEHGCMVYEISFDCNGWEYDYDIDATTGAVIKHHQEEHHVNEHHSDHHSNAAANAPGDYIGEAAAKEAALAHAGVAVGDITHYECKLDRENGIMVYEIEFKCAGYEYEYEINASTSAVVKYEKDWDD